MTDLQLDLARPTATDLEGVAAKLAIHFDKWLSPALETKDDWFNDYEKGIWFFLFRDPENNLVLLAYNEEIGYVPDVGLIAEALSTLSFFKKYDVKNVVYAAVDMGHETRYVLEEMNILPVRFVMI